MTRHAKTAVELLWESASPGEPNECWIWPGRKNDAGYGILRTFEKLPDGAHKRVNSRVHRVAFAWRHGPIEDGVVLDHICHNEDAECRGGIECIHRSCFNPEHLRPKTTGENVLSSPLTISSRNALKTHCPQGHAYTPENTRVERDGGRKCRACGRDRARTAHTRRKESEPQKVKEPLPHPNSLKTQCPQGHEYTPDNTYLTPKGSRVCKACRRVRLREWKRAHRQ